MNKFRLLQNKKLVYFLHFVVWGVLFISPYLFSYGQEELSFVARRSWVSLLIYAFLFYINYLWLIKKFIFNNKILIFITINVIVIALLVILKHELIFKLLTEDPHFRRPSRPSRSFFIYFDSISMIIPMVFALAFRISERWVKTESEKNEVENYKLQAELQHLKYQIQPHFFFNSLNNIYSLVDISPEKAKETIHSLSKLMRYLLYESNTETVRLEKEIEFLNKYIELMKLRLTEKTQVKVNFPKISSSIQIPPLLFISIIENAFKHGVSATQTSVIEFSMELWEDRISLFSKNHNFQKNITDKSGSGIGIQNLKKRLDLLYPNQYEYSSEICGNEFIVNLEIKLKTNEFQ